MAPNSGIGRPSEYTDEVAAIICTRLAEGESLRAICEDVDMPHRATVFRWLEVHAAFRDQYARARARQADAYADDIVHISDTEADAQKARVRIDARKWHASKLAPKKYGDRVELAGSGPGGSLLHLDAAALAKLSDDELNQIIAVQSKLAAVTGSSGGEGEAGG